MGDQDWNIRELWSDGRLRQGFEKQERPAFKRLVSLFVEYEMGGWFAPGHESCWHRGINLLPGRGPKSYDIDAPGFAHAALGERWTIVRADVAMPETGRRQATRARMSHAQFVERLHEYNLHSLEFFEGRQVQVLRLHKKPCSQCGKTFAELAEEEGAGEFWVPEMGFSYFSSEESPLKFCGGCMREVVYAWHENVSVLAKQGISLFKWEKPLRNTAVAPSPPRGC